MTGYLLIGALTLLVIAFWAWVMAPLWRGDLPNPPSDPRLAALLIEREAALAELRDLDADHRNGRLSATDHARMRAETVERGAWVLAAMDRVLADQGTAVPTEQAPDPNS